jgi:hypothetical protein
MLREKAKLGFFLFWAVTCAVWIGAWLVVDYLLVPEPLRVSALRLVAIGLATGLLPIAVLCVGRAVLYLIVQGLAFTRRRLPAFRGAASGRRSVARAPDPSPRRASAVADEYQSSAGPL